jgi:hypothetical protein
VSRTTFERIVFATIIAAMFILAIGLNNSALGADAEIVESDVIETDLRAFWAEDWDEFQGSDWARWEASAMELSEQATGRTCQRYASTYVGIVRLMESAHTTGDHHDYYAALDLKIGSDHWWSACFTELPD